MDKKKEKNKDSIPLFAYVTFEESTGAHRAMQVYRDTWISYWFLSGRKMFKGKRLHVERSPEPSIIIWENLGYTDYHRFRRRVITWIISIILLVLSAIATFSSRAFEQRAQNSGGDVDCPIGYDSLSEEQQLEYSQNNPGN